MENESNDIILNLSGSGRRNSRSSSLRRGSLSLSRSESFQIDDDVESRSVSEAGDIGDRFLNSKRHSESCSIRFSLDNASEHGVVFPIFEEKFKSHDSTALDTTLPVSPLPEGTISPLSTDAMMSKDDKRDGEVPILLPQTLELISCLFYLSVFGILGVLTRYSLQKLFGPTVARVTSDHSILYLDLPSNMVGSFLMGWLGVVFKPDIASISDHLAIGLTTGYLGSVTTFSGWNQKMLDLAIDGQWVFAVVGFLLGLFLAAYSIKYGIATAKSFKSLLESRSKNQTNRSNNWRIDTFKRHAAVMSALGLLLVTLWSLSGVFLKEEFDGGNSASQLWLACLVAAPGVWLRWFLARLNGRGLGKTGSLKWVPFGTLIVNVSASCIMAALATLKKAVDTKNCTTIASGIQLGFLGCLSTVSTFIAEYNAMEESSKPWRATAYSLSTILVSFGLGILIYAIPVWTRGYN